MAPKLIRQKVADGDSNYFRAVRVHQLLDELVHAVYIGFR